MYAIMISNINKSFNMIDKGTGKWELDDWLQSYELFFSAENNIIQKNLTSFFANISKTISAISASFPLMMSQFITKLDSRETTTLAILGHITQSWGVKLWPSTTKGTSCRLGSFWDNDQNSLQNIKKIKGNIDFVNFVFPKVSL